MLPPKKLLNSKMPKFVELRRQSLEEYLERLLAIPSIVQSDEVVSFLNVPSKLFRTNVGEQKVLPTWTDECNTAPHGLELDEPVWTVAGSAQDCFSKGLGTVVTDALQTAETDDAWQLPIGSIVESYHRFFWGSGSPLGGSSCVSSVSRHTEQPLQSPPSVDAPYLFEALHTYQAKSGRELSFGKGDQLVVTSIDPTTGWWYGKTSSSECGLIPLTFVKRVDTSEG
jgi:hypothetical protein